MDLLEEIWFATGKHESSLEAIVYKERDILYTRTTNIPSVFFLRGGQFLYWILSVQLTGGGGTKQSVISGPISCR